MLHDDGPDGPVSIAEAESNTQLLLVAGHDSTVNTLSNCIMTLLRNQGAWDLVRDNPDLIPRTVEEVQRLQGAVQFFPSRWATADIEIGGTRIPAGSAVFLVWAAANRDPRQFENPDRFDPMRTDNEHLGFGSGIHLLWRPAGPPGDQHRPEVFLRRVRSPAGGRPAAVPAQPGVPRAPAPVGGFRLDRLSVGAAWQSGRVSSPQALDRFSPLTRSWFAGTFVQPTPAQAQAWSAIANGDNTLVIAPTGSGKTLAAFLWAIDRLAHQPDVRGTRVLYVSPLKALAVDVERNLRTPLTGITRIAERDGLPAPRISVGCAPVTPAGPAPRTDHPTARHPHHHPGVAVLMLTSAARETLAGCRR